MRQSILYLRIMHEPDQKSGIHIEVLLRADIEKYVGWLLGHKSTTTFRAANIKEPGLESFPDTPMINFEHWRRESLKEETDFLNWKYKNSILPKDALRDLEIERICNKVNVEYSLEIECLIESLLTDRFYEMANLIGKLDYLKSLSFENPLDVKSSSSGDKNVPSHAIKHVYLTKAGGQPVTKTNKDILAAQDGCAGSSLLKEYSKYSDDSQRLNLRGNKRSDGQLKRNFEIALNLLQ